MQAFFDNVLHKLECIKFATEYNRGTNNDKNMSIAQLFREDNPEAFAALSNMAFKEQMVQLQEPFKRFKVERQKIVTARNHLLRAYTLVCSATP